MGFNYLIFNLIIIFGPLVASFFSWVVKPKFLPAFLSLFLVALFFFLFDIVVTDFFWSFNQDYILNVKILNVPLEEILFFIFTGYACLFLYVNLKQKKFFYREVNLLLLWFLIFSFLSISFYSLSLGKYYTSSIFFIFAFLIIVDIYFFKTNLFKQLFFWQFLLIIFFLTLIFNYYLTSKPVVIYNDELNLKFRILTIPLEDFIYGFSFISLIVMLYELFLKSNKSVFKLNSHYD